MVMINKYFIHRYWEKVTLVVCCKVLCHEDDIFHGRVTSHDVDEGWWMISYDDGDFEEMNFDELQCAMNLHSALNKNLSTNNAASRTVDAAPLSALEADNDLSLPVLLHLRESGLSSSVVRYRRNTLCHKSFSNWDGVDGQYLVYHFHLRKLEGRYNDGWDP